MRGLTNQVHITEQTYDDLRKNPELAWDQTILLAELAEVKALLDQYAHVNEAVLGRKGPGRRGGVDKFAMVELDTVQQTLQMIAKVDPQDREALRSVLGQVGKVLNLIGTDPLCEVLAGGIESLPALAKELGKEPPKVRIQDHGIVIRSQASSLLKNLFNHFLRNTVDHGIESADARIAKGKRPEGQIDVELKVDDGKLIINLRDDGRGLAMSRIRQKALEQGWLDSAQKISDEEVAMFIFKSGVSTAEAVTEISGRGVGLDAVKGFIEKEGGSIVLHFLDDKVGADFRSFETEINLPDRYAASAEAPRVLEAVMSKAAPQAVVDSPTSKSLI